MKNSDSSNTINLNKYISSQEKISDTIIWDNYGYSSGSQGFASQLDVLFPLNCQVGDDFMLNSDMQVTVVHWWGVFWEGDSPWPNPTDFNIIFYAMTEQELCRQVPEWTTRHRLHSQSISYLS